jgi:hypothetical protein
MNKEENQLIERLIIANTISVSDNLHFVYLKQLYNSVEEVYNENINHIPANHIYVQCENPENELEVILHILAGKLTTNGKIAFKLFKTQNKIIVETN